LACSRHSDNPNIHDNYKKCYGVPELEFDVKYQKKSGSSSSKTVKANIK